MRVRWRDDMRKCANVFVLQLHEQLPGSDRADNMLCSGIIEVKWFIRKTIRPHLKLSLLLRVNSLALSFGPQWLEHVCERVCASVCASVLH